MSRAGHPGTMAGSTAPKGRGEPRGPWLRAPCARWSRLRVPRAFRSCWYANLPPPSLTVPPRLPLVKGFRRRPGSVPRAAPVAAVGL